MTAYSDLIRKKRDGKELTPRELEDLVEGFLTDEMEASQTGALLMAIYFNSLTESETYQLTKIMADSGRRFDLSSVEGFRVDKHSTGGVGDHVSLILLPLVAACGLKIGKLSGRALGHTGGTIDKIESIPGFQVDLKPEEFVKHVEKSGLAIMEHSEETVPADHRIYGLRDRTATVESLPLIASSVMSKKLVTEPQGLVLDVKVGAGAFMKEIERAEKLGRSCISIGEKEGITTSVLITDMNRPLGKTVGNSLAMKEAIEALGNESKGALREVCIQLATELLLQSGDYASESEARGRLIEVLKKGEALSKFKEMIENQEGDPAVIEDTDLLPSSERKEAVKSPKDGFLSDIDPLLVAKAANTAGTAEERLDRSAGVELKKRIGEEVKKGQPLALLHHNPPGDKKEALNLLRKSFSVSSGTRKPEPPPLVKSKIRGSE